MTASVLEGSWGDGSLAPCGTPWWLLTVTPGSKRRFGGEKRLAAYLNFNVEVGETFTMRQLREALGADGVAESAEQLGRRLRALRPDDWVITSYKDDRTLPPDTYRLDAVGTRVWLCERNDRDQVSGATERIVIERDGRRCVICSVGHGEEYPGQPGSVARLTVGHRVPGARRGGASPDDLQTECARHNESTRDEHPDPERYDEVWPSVRGLKGAELRQMAGWLRAGRRGRTKLEIAYDRVLRLTPAERERVLEEIERIVGDGSK